MNKEFKDWNVVKSKTGCCREGFPVGQTLVRDPETLNRVVKDLNIEEPVIEKYFHKDGAGCSVLEHDLTEQEAQAMLDGLCAKFNVLAKCYGVEGLHDVSYLEVKGVYDDNFHGEK